MDPIIIIDFLSKEWMINMIITLSFIALYFIIAFKINEEKLPIILKVSSLLVLLMTLANHLILIFIDSWTVTDNLPLHLCSISVGEKSRSSQINKINFT